MRGQTLVELLVTIGLAAILLPALLVGSYASSSGRAQNEQRIQAYTMLQAMEEEMRSIREGSWSAIATDGTYNIKNAGTTWALSSGSITTNGFTQQVVIGDVYRDSTGNIVTSGGTIDPSTKSITATVSWNYPYPSSSSETFYLTRYLNNYAKVDTTVSDFNAGTLLGTAVTDTSGGEVTLGNGGNADWCKPQDSLINTLTMPKQANTIMALPGEAYLGTGDGTNGVTFVNVSITQPLPPATPSASIVGTYSSSYKTNDIFSDGRYVYLATDGSSQQVLILDTSTTPYNVIGTISVPSGVAANGVYVYNNTAYVTSSNELYTFDVTTKTGSHTTPLTSVKMYFSFFSPDPLAKQVVVSNGYAFVGTANTLFGLQKFKIINNGATLSLVGVSNFTWNQSSEGLAVNSDGTRAYIAFDKGTGLGSLFPDGFFIVDTSYPDQGSWWSQFFPNFYNIIGTYNSGATDPDGMAIAAANRAILVGNGGSQQYQVIDTSNESNPILCGGMSISQGVFGVSTVLQSNGYAYSYIISGESQNQFKIIEGGVGGSYSDSGTYESNTFDASAQAAFNSVLADISQPPSTQIKMQVGVANPVNGSCNNVSSFTYVGPNGDPTQYFTSSSSAIMAAIPVGAYGANYVNPGQCYRYKLWLSTTSLTQLPVVYDVSTNYSL